MNREELKKRKAYIFKREQEHIEYLKKMDKVYEKEIDEMYQRTMKRIENELNHLYLKYADKEGLTMDDAYKKISKVDVSKFSKKASDYLEKYNFSEKAQEELSLYNLKMRVSRLELMKREILLETLRLADDEERLLDERLQDTVLDELERQADILGLSKEIRKKVVKNGRKIVDADFHGANFSKRIWANQKELTSRLQVGLERSILQGENPQKWASNLTGLIHKDVGAKASNWAKRIAVTETARVQIDTSIFTFKELGYKKYIWIAEIDEKTCDICEELDGEIYDLKDSSIGFNTPPIHPWCRCAVAPFYDEENLDNEEETGYNEDEEGHRGIDRDFQINSEVINSSAYDNKFRELDEPIEVQRIIKQEARKMLKHRNGTEYEDLAFINTETEEVLRNIHYDEKRTVKPTKEMKRMMKKDAKDIVTVHNHPGNTIPSSPDLLVASQRGQKYGIIACHDGTVYRYELLEDFNYSDTQLYDIITRENRNYNLEEWEDLTNELLDVLGLKLEELE